MLAIPTLLAFGCYQVLGKEIFEGSEYNDRGSCDVFFPAKIGWKFAGAYR